MKLYIFLFLINTLSFYALLAYDYSSIDLFHNQQEPIAGQSIPNITVAIDNFVPTVQSYNDTKQTKRLYLYNKSGARIDVAYFRRLSRQDIENWCNSHDSEYLFGVHYLYSNQHYLNYIQGCSGYENHIFTLYNDIHTDHGFRKSLREMPGFEDELGFQKLIGYEAERIKTARAARVHEEQLRKNHAIENRQQAKLQVCKVLNNQFEQKFLDAEENKNAALAKRYEKRIGVVNKTIEQNAREFDYSHLVKKNHVSNDPDAEVFNYCYGTVLDQQLHEELCDIRARTCTLQTSNPENFHAQTLAPMIYRFTALAKKEMDYGKAFDLSDFSDALIRIASGGIDILKKIPAAIGRGSRALGKGVVRGVKTVASPQRWKEVGEGIVNLGTFLVGELVQQENREEACAALNTDLLYKNSEEYYCYTQAQRKAISDHVQTSFARLKKMSRRELVEHGAEIGTTLVLDAVVMNAAGWFVNASGRAVVNELAEIMQVTNPLARESMVEIAGVGKIMLEDNSGISAQGKSPLQILQSSARDIKQWSKLNISALKNTQNFKQGALEHILDGELNARGKAVGFHHEGMLMAKGKIIKGTESIPNEFGVYTAKVEVNGVPKVSNGGISSFFPKNWDSQKVVDSINEAFSNKQLVDGTRNTFRGELSNGMQIEMYIDSATNKIISAFPLPGV